MLTDNFGRRFEYLRMSITDVCNFRCNYCLPNGYQCDSSREFLSLDEISTLLQAFAQLGTKKVRITGGEPCLRKDLVEIVKIAKNTPGIERVAMTTNGFNLENKIESLVNAGLDALNLSLDSLDPRMFTAITGSTQHSKILSGLNKAAEMGISSIKINAVLLKQYNPNVLSEFQHWLKDKPFSVRFIELMQTGDNLSFFERNHLSGEQLKQQLLSEGWQLCIRSKLDGPAQEFSHPDYAGRIGLIMPYSKDFCKNCNRLRVSALGKLHLCLFAEQGIELRRYLQMQDVDATVSAIQSAMTDKKISHELQQGFTGATTHLAMLGG
ncbi:GTP 3',8-cyclase MoaA [Glaciecola sp. 1036]|uniref:GTP 3',8-cyclase MoaA n=1 Tax=Alteromonadaceae TaxID=72275 RepID=UPI003CFF02C4